MKFPPKALPVVAVYFLWHWCIRIQARVKLPNGAMWLTHLRKILRFRLDWNASIWWQVFVWRRQNKTRKLWLFHLQCRTKTLTASRQTKSKKKQKKAKKDEKSFIGRESNPGHPRGRREFYHWTTDASAALNVTLRIMPLCMWGIAADK